MTLRVHRPLASCAPDVPNGHRLERYLTSTELRYLRTALSGVKTGSALDVGCATGRLSFPLMNMGFDVVGIDIDSRALEAFLRQDPGARLATASAERLPFAAESFACTIAVQVVDYFSDRSGFYRDVWRSLAPGGLLLVTLTNRCSIKGFVYDWWLRLVAPKRDRRFYERDYATGRAEIVSAGFEIAYAWGYNWNLLPRDADNVLVDVFASIERVLGLKRWPALSPLVFVVARKVG